MWGDTALANFSELEAGNDSGIELIFTYTLDKKLTGVVANVACPAQVLEHRNFMSSDYWGKVKQFLRKELGQDSQCLHAGILCFSHPRDGRPVMVMADLPDYFKEVLNKLERMI